MMTKKRIRYEQLVSNYHLDLYKYACWLIGDSNVAQDVLQETFLRAWKSLDSLKDDKAAKAWLITILRRENARRFERKQFNTVDIDDVSLAADDSDCDVNYITTEIREHIMMLSEEYRDPLLLQVVFGYDSEQISQILSLNPKTVLTRLFRARNQLRAVINANTNIVDSGVKNG